MKDIYKRPGPKAGSGRTPEIPGFFWASPEEWLEAHQTLDLLFEKYGPALDGVRHWASRYKDGLEGLFPVFDRYTALVCPYCASVCCLKALAAFDFKDLLMMHALDLDPPPHQLRLREHESCRFIGPDGCLLPRIKRPFICTWYMCAPMLELYRQERPRLQRWFSSLMSEAQRHRRAMEEEFIMIVTG